MLMAGLRRWGRAGLVGDWWLLALLVSVALLPIWSVSRVPTTDGPCHVYNAWILGELVAGDAPFLAEHYEIDKRPFPNWLGHLVLALLMVVVDPTTAEKLLVSGCVVLLLTGVRQLERTVGQRRPWVYALVFPLCFNQLLQMGFYNFSLGLGLFPWVLAWWWRERSRPGWRFAVQLNLLLTALYFAHLVPHLVAGGCLGLLALGVLAGDRRRGLVHLAILAPQAILPAWFLTASPGGASSSPHSFSTLAHYLFELQVLLSFGRPQVWLGRLLVVSFAVLVGFTIHQCRRASRGHVASERRAAPSPDLFLLLVVAITLLYFFGPAGAAGGTMAENRLSLFPWLLLVPWLEPGFSPRVERLVVAGLACLAVAYSLYLTDRYRVVARDVDDFLAVTKSIAPGSRLLPLLFERGSPHELLGMLGHAKSYAAIDSRSIDWDNYQAASGYFPIRFRPQLTRPSVYEMQALPGRFELRPHLAIVDYVFCRKLPADAAAARVLRGQYRLVEQQGDMQLFVRRNRATRR